MHGEWISVDKRLPKPFEEVLLLVNGWDVRYGFTPCNGGDASFYDFALIDFETDRVELNPIGPGRVSHWMPLPSPPEQES